MTNQEQIIAPSLELVQQWADMLSSRSDHAVFSLAAQWGWDQRGAATESELQKAADQEFEACAQWVEVNFGRHPTHNLHQFRRPKPPSLKEQALEALNQMDEPLGIVTARRASIIRQALEALPE